MNNTLKHPVYNAELVKSCHDLSGKWDPTKSAWLFGEMVADKVKELDDLFNSDLVIVEIKADADIIGKRHKPISFCGYAIARAYGRDSGGKLGDNIAKISGTIGSGGSSKNWHTTIDKDSVFRLKMSRNLLAKHADFYDNTDDFSFEIKE